MCIRIIYQQRLIFNISFEKIYACIIFHTTKALKIKQHLKQTSQETSTQDFDLVVFNDM